MFRSSLSYLISILYHFSLYIRKTADPLFPQLFTQPFTQPSSRFPFPLPSTTPFALFASFAAFQFFNHKERKVHKAVVRALRLYNPFPFPLRSLRSLRLKTSTSHPPYLPIHQPPIPQPLPKMPPPTRSPIEKPPLKKIPNTEIRHRPKITRQLIISIRIQPQNPLALNRQIIQRPIKLLSIKPRPFMLNNRRAKSAAVLSLRSSSRIDQPPRKKVPRSYRRTHRLASEFCPQRSAAEPPSFPSFPPATTNHYPLPLTTNH